MQYLLDLVVSAVSYNPIFGPLLDMWIFYLGFVLYAGCQNAIEKRRWAVIIPALPIVLPAGLIDVLFNQSIGRLMFLETKYTLTFSNRLQGHYYEDGWRGDLARYIGGAVDAILPHHIDQKKQ
jgi:hypothetical protein